MVGIEIRNVTKRFGSTVAVDGVSLSIRSGELFFLLGPSGCGKTTLLRLMAGFETPDEGEIFLGDRSVATVPAHRRNTALVFQNYALWPHMTVAQNVAYGLEERGMSRPERKERVSRALQSVHMQEYAERMPPQLSGGQQQRIALARALVVEPDVVLLDEPLSNLDARLRVEMRHEIRRIHDEVGITMVYVTHDQKESLSMADRIAVMSMGRVEQVGVPREIYREPANRFVAGFIGEANLAPGRRVSTDALRSVVETPLGRWTVMAGPAGAGVDAEVLCMVRPESLKLGRIEGLNTFKARVVRNAYLGELEELVVTTAAGEWRVLVANPGQAMPGPGQEIELSFAADDARVLSV
jgi:iron(III) transport system ATP-binding protein